MGLRGAIDSTVEGAKYIYKETTSFGNFVYDNIEAGIEETREKPIPGAKNNPKKQADPIANRPGVIETELSKQKGGAYTKEAQSAKYKLDRDKTATEGKAPRSSVNNWSLLKYKGGPLDGGYDFKSYKELKRNAESGAALNPTAKTIIEECSKVQKADGYQYKMADFIYCEHYGKIPNNHLLTLRRFAFPVEDNIISPKAFDADGKAYEAAQAALATAVTWMSPSIGNTLNEILKFSVGYNWKEAKAELQEINSKSRDKGMLGSALDSFPLTENIAGGLQGESASSTYRRKQQGDAWDPIKQTYPNHSLVPLNIIDSVQIREKGLKWSQEFSLTFMFDMKGIPNTSPKVAMLDVLANMLVLTSNQAPFWGGAVRYTGGGKKGKPLGDLKKLQSGDLKGFFGSIIKDLSKTITGSLKDIFKGGDSNILNNVIGGGAMKLLGGPQGGQIAAALLTGEATGQWHLTIGNPLNPIAVIGNLAMQDADFELMGPLGYEDFPTKLKVTIKLQPGRPRGKDDIESMFNAGKGRLYVAEEGLIDVNKSYDVDAYGKQNGTPNVLNKKIGKFANG